MLRAIRTGDIFLKRLRPLSSIRGCVAAALGVLCLACMGCRPDAPQPPSAGDAEVAVDRSRLVQPNLNLPALELTPDNLALTAARLDPKFSLRDYARDAAAQHSNIAPEAYFARLEQAFALLDPAAPFRIEKSVRLGRPKADTNTISVGLITKNVLGLSNPATSPAATEDSRQFPGRLLVLVPNAEVAKRLPLSPQRAAEWNGMLDSRSAHAVAGHGVALLAPAAYLGRGQFQFVVVRVEISHNNQTLYTFSEDRSLAGLVDQSLLRDGVTWAVSPNHRYNLFGSRLLEVLPEGEDWLGKCSHQGREGEHRLVQCSGPLDWRGISLRRKHDYRGGRLERVELSNPNPIDEKATQRMQQWFVTATKLPRRQAPPNNFTKFETRFEWFSDRLAEGSELPFLVFATTSVPTE